MENAMKHIHRTRGDRIFDAINVAALCLLLAVILYPLIYVLSCSFSDPLLVVQSKITFLPMQPTLVAYQRVFRNELIVTGYQNTLFYTLLGTALNVAVTTMMAYPLSRHDFAARRPITMLTAFTMLFSGGMIPTFLVVKNLGLIDTVWSLVLPGLVSPWNMFIMKNYFQTSIPTELYEAASIDGADNFHLLRSVVLPLSAPIVAVMVLYYGVAHWNSYFSVRLLHRVPGNQARQFDPVIFRIQFPERKNKVLECQLSLLLVHPPSLLCKLLVGSSRFSLHLYDTIRAVHMLVFLCFGGCGADSILTPFSICATAPATRFNWCCAAFSAPTTTASRAARAATAA